MKSRFSRIVIVLLGIFLGIAIIYTLTVLGNRSRGPLEDSMVKIGSGITELDKLFFSKTKRKKRREKLGWLKPSLQHKDSLLSSEHFLLGAFDNMDIENYEHLIALEDSLDQVFPLIHIYTAWGSKPDQRFPLNQVKAIHALGSIPVITWEPWLTDFETSEHPGLRPKETRDKNGLSDISNGLYDFYLDRWISDLKETDKTVMIRFGHEMNDPYRYVWGPQNNDPESFVLCWKYIVDYFRKKEIRNVLWIWSPHIAYNHFDAYYPGESYVDWIGVGTLNYGEVAVWSKWWTFNEIFGTYYEDLSRFGKPIMLSEFGSLEVGGDRIAWYSDAICDLHEKYPEVLSLMFFHFNNDRTLTDKSLDWYIIQDPVLLDTVSNCLKEL